MQQYKVDHKSIKTQFNVAKECNMVLSKCKVMQYFANVPKLYGYKVDQQKFNT